MHIDNRYISDGERVDTSFYGKYAVGTKFMIFYATSQLLQIF